MDPEAIIASLATYDNGAAAQARLGSASQRKMCHEETRKGPTAL